MIERELEQDELERQDPDVVPDREAMSLITTDPAAYSSIADLPAMDAEPSDPTSRAADDAATTGTDAADSDPAGSQSGSESVTSEDRSEQISASDTAYAESWAHRTLRR